MRKIIIFIIFLSFHLFGFNQNQRWETYIGISNRNDYVNSLIEYYDKGYYLVGGFEYEKGWNIKTDINGNILWEKVFKYGSYPINGTGVTIDENGNQYYCGTIWPDGVTSWPFISKFDSCGEKLWCKLIVDVQYEYGGGRDVIISNENEIIMLTRFESEEQINQIFLYGFNENGKVLWHKAYASKENHPEIALASGKKLYNFQEDYLITGYCYWPFPGNTNHVYLRPFFIGIDSLFNEKWIMPFSVMDSVYGNAYSAIALNDSLIMGVGKRRYYNNTTNSLLMFFNNDGEEYGFNQIANEQIGSEIKANFIYDIERINDTLFLTTSFFGTEYNGNPIGEFVIDTAGTLFNFQSRPNTLTSPYLIKTTDNKYVIATGINVGKSDWDILMYKINENLESVPFDTNQYTYDSLCPHQIQSGNIDLSDCLIWTDIGEIPSPEEYYAKQKTIPIKVFPNPAKENITFCFENTKYHQNMQLQCFDVFGRIIFKEKIYTAQLETKINVSLWNEGLYVAVIMSEGKVLGKVKFVVLR